MRGFSTSRTSAAAPPAPMARRLPIACVAAGPQRVPASLRSRCGDRQHLQRHRRGRPRGPRFHPPRPPPQPRARIVVTGCYAQRAPANWPHSRRGRGGRQQPQGARCPRLWLTCRATAGRRATRPATPANGLSQIQRGLASRVGPTAGGVSRRPLRPLFSRRSAARSRRADPPQPQDPGGLRQSLHLLRHSADARLRRGALPAETVCSQVEGFVAAGGNELVLSGINLGRWGRDLAEPQAIQTAPTLAGWSARSSSKPLCRACASVPSSRWTGTAELIALMAEFGGTQRSGAPRASAAAVRFRRRTAPHAPPLPPLALRRKVAALLRAAGPELTLGADVMVGFPGETDSRVRRNPGLHSRAALRLSAPVPVFAAPRHAAWALHAAAPVPRRPLSKSAWPLSARSWPRRVRAHRRRLSGTRASMPSLCTHPGLANDSRPHRRPH